jgi:hypothetical protein
VQHLGRNCASMPVGWQMPSWMCLIGNLHRCLRIHISILSPTSSPSTRRRQSLGGRRRQKGLRCVPPTKRKVIRTTVVRGWPHRPAHMSPSFCADGPTFIRCSATRGTLDLGARRWHALGGGGYT